MLSKKIFISKLGPPQKLPSKAQAAPRAHGHGLSPVRVAPCTPWHPIPRPQSPSQGSAPAVAPVGISRCPGRATLGVEITEVKLS